MKNKFLLFLATGALPLQASSAPEPKSPVADSASPSAIVSQPKQKHAESRDPNSDNNRCQEICIELFQGGPWECPAQAFYKKDAQ